MKPRSIPVSLVTLNQLQSHLERARVSALQLRVDGDRLERLLYLRDQLTRAIALLHAARKRGERKAGL